MIERRWELHWEMPCRGRFCDRGAAKHASRLPNAATAVGTCESVTYLLVAPHKWIQRVQRHPIAIIISVGLSSSLRRPFWLKCLTGSCPRSNQFWHRLRGVRAAEAKFFSHGLGRRDYVTGKVWKNKPLLSGSARIRPPPRRPHGTASITRAVAR